MQKNRPYLKKEISILQWQFTVLFAFATVNFTKQLAFLLQAVLEAVDCDDEPAADREEPQVRLAEDVSSDHALSSVTREQHRCAGQQLEPVGLLADAGHVIVNAEFIILNAEFNIFNAAFIIFNAKFT